MGEVALRSIAAGIEATRGSAVAVTKRLYGMATVTYARPHRFAMEDRGNFADKWRGNPKLTEAGLTLAADATFEDLPFYADTFLRGGVTPSGSAASGYSWSFLPDTTADTLGTRTYLCGDDTVRWQGAFGTTDSAQFTLALDDALHMSLGVFVNDWTVSGPPPALTDRVVESVMGWQARLFIDPDGTAPGTTPVAGRFVGATWNVKNQNKRKYFGDGAPVFTKLGRGRRQVDCSITFEAADANQFTDFTQSNPKVLRVALIGSSIAGSSVGSTNANIAAGTVTAIPVAALGASVAGGVGITVGGTAFAVTTAGAAAGATSIPVVSQNLGAAIASGAAVTAAKTMRFDFWGLFDTFVVGNRDTNTTFQLDLMDVVSNAAATEFAITVVNGQAAL